MTTPMDEENRIIADMAAFLGIPFNRRTGPFMKQCADRIRAYGDRRAQEAAEAAIDGWRPIETAPKDGSEFLTVMDGRHQIVRWNSESLHRNPRPHFSPWHPLQGMLWVRDNQPRYWMPLPSPPKGSTVG